MKRKIPVLISVSSAGKRVPRELDEISIATSEQIIEYANTGAFEIFALKSEVVRQVISLISKLFIDMNECADFTDEDLNNVVLNCTQSGESLYKKKIAREMIQTLLDRYYYPYHEKLYSYSLSEVVLGLDCYSVEQIGTNSELESDYDYNSDYDVVSQPWIRLTTVKGSICPDYWVELLAECFEDQFKSEISVEKADEDSSILSQHSKEMPWIKLEVVSGFFMTNKEKKLKILNALRQWINKVGA